MSGIRRSQLAGSARDIPPHPSFASGDPDNCNGLDWAAGARGRRRHDLAARRGFPAVDVVAFSRRSGTSRSRKPARKPKISTICGVDARSLKLISPMVRRGRILQLTSCTRTPAQMTPIERRSALSIEGAAGQDVRRFYAGDFDRGAHAPCYGPSSRG